MKDENIYVFICAKSNYFGSTFEYSGTFAIAKDVNWDNLIDHITEKTTAAGLIGGGGFAALSAFKGQKAGMMFARFISGIAKVTGFPNRFTG